ncbi:hypothetical protein niasHT_028114 [Heterodera trifolii]|uniref:Uncharacterized protein n=1 Tax=Heterodera trifolii TaxID=157864 RepID=A0ABD2J1D2_9BILA
MTLCSNSKKSNTKSTRCFMVDCLRGRLSRKRKKLKFNSPIEPNLEVIVCKLVERTTSGSENSSEKFIKSSTSN